MAVTLTEILNQWNDAGVFSYLIPVLLIFAVVFAIIEKSRIFSKKVGGKESEEYEDNRGVSAVIALAIALLSIQFDFVSIFFAQIFPNFGIGLSIVLVVLILLGMVNQQDNAKWAGWVIAVGLFLWAIVNWSEWFGSGITFSYWFQEYFYPLLIVAIVVGVFYLFVRDPKGSRDDDGRGGGRGRRRRE